MKPAVLQSLSNMTLGLVIVAFACLSECFAGIADTEAAAESTVVKKIGERILRDKSNKGKWLESNPPNMAAVLTYICLLISLQLVISANAGTYKPFDRFAV